MTDTSKVLRYLERAAARADGGDDPDPPPEAETIRATREHLKEAAAHAHVGRDVPAGARLRPVKQAFVATLRPVTSYQRVFNDEVLAAVDALTAAADRLARQLTLHDQRTARLQAGVATTDLTVDDLSDDVRSLADRLEGLGASVDALRTELAAVRSTELAALRGELAALSAKQDLIFRAAREALPAGGETAARAQHELAAQVDEREAALRSELTEAFRGTRQSVKESLAAHVGAIEAAAGSGPVIDLAPSRGEWLEALRDADVSAYGVDPDPAVVAEAAERGLDVRAADPLEHLRSVPEGSARAVTLLGAADRYELADLVGVVDAALLALGPGGVLLIDAPNPTNVTVGAASAWLDPTARRPLHPQFLELLVMARGFAEVEVRYGPASDGPRLGVDDLVTADDDPVRAQAVVDRINWALAGPTDFAVVARKAAPPT
jgi:hypothetical protein